DSTDGRPPTAELSDTGALENHAPDGRSLSHQKHSHRDQAPLNGSKVGGWNGQPGRCAGLPARRESEVRLLGTGCLRLNWVSFALWSASCRPEQAGSLFHPVGGKRYEILRLATMPGEAK